MRVPAHLGLHHSFRVRHLYAPPALMNSETLTLIIEKLCLLSATFNSFEALIKMISLPIFTALQAKLLVSRSEIQMTLSLNSFLILLTL